MYHMDKIYIVDTYYHMDKVYIVYIYVNECM